MVTATGVLFIVFMTLVNYRGIRLGEHVQRVLTYVQYVSLGIFALAIIVRIAGGAPEGQAFDIEWFNPAGAFADPGAVVHGALLALFIYWGWDTCLAVNEETENPSTTPGRGAVISAFVLVAIYVSVALLVMMYATVGTEGIGLGNEANQDDVFLAMKDVVLGPWGWLIVVAVLASVLSSTQTTILPTARGTLSMGVHGALPPKFGEVHPRNQTPGFSTQVMGAAAVVYYVAMSFLSENLLSDSISAISLFIAFYYALTGFACFWYFRGTPSAASARNLWFRGILPLAGRTDPDRGVLHLRRPDVGPGLRRHADLGRRRGLCQRRGAPGPGRGAGRRLPVPAVDAGILHRQPATAGAPRRPRIYERRRTHSDVPRR